MDVTNVIRPRFSLSNQNPCRDSLRETERHSPFYLRRPPLALFALFDSHLFSDLLHCRASYSTMVHISPHAQCPTLPVKKVNAMDRGRQDRKNDPSTIFARYYTQQVLSFRHCEAMAADFRASLIPRIARTCARHSRFHRTQ
jgi:hypothetical protein